jgi:hypothetical protein
MVMPAQAASGGHGAAAARHMNLNCGWNYRSSYDARTASIQCPDVFNPVAAFGHYVGHDEPGVWFDSKVPGSGNRARWQLTLPTDPAPSSVPGAKIYSFEQHRADLHLQAGLGQQHRQPEGQRQARRVGLPGAAVLPVGLGAAAGRHLL